LFKAHDFDLVTFLKDLFQSATKIKGTSEKKLAYHIDVVLVCFDDI